MSAKADATDLDSYELKTNVTSKGAADTPVYFDANGVATPITSYAGKAATAGVADSATAVAWSGVQNTPTTLAGYGITDAQGTLTFDNAPTADSNNPVKSGGVYTALSAKADSADLGALATMNTVGTDEIDANAVTLAKLSASLPSACQGSGAECVLKSSSGALAWEVIQRATGETPNNTTGSNAQ